MRLIMGSGAAKTFRSDKKQTTGLAIRTNPVVFPLQWSDQASLAADAFIDLKHLVELLVGVGRHVARP